MTSRERADRAIFVSGYPQTDSETLRRCVVAAIDAAVTEAVAAERRNFESAIKAYFDNARGAK